MTSMLSLDQWGSKIRSLRRSRGLSAEIAARRAGEHRNTLLAFERGTGNLELSNFLAICAALDVSLVLAPSAVAGALAAANEGELRQTELQRRLAALQAGREGAQ
jgi:transcriptional regulator with XRE-family HTH domain